MTTLQNKSHMTSVKTKTLTTLENKDFTTLENEVHDNLAK